MLGDLYSSRVIMACDRFCCLQHRCNVTRPSQPQKGLLWNPSNG